MERRWAAFSGSVATAMMTSRAPARAVLRRVSSRMGRRRAPLVVQSPLAPPGRDGFEQLRRDDQARSGTNDVDPAGPVLLHGGVYGGAGNVPYVNPGLV